MQICLKCWNQLLVIALMSLPTLIQAQTKATITGQITTTTGQPLGLVSVLLDDGNTWDYTDDTGHYSLHNITKGKHRISVNLFGYQTLTKSITISTARKSVLNFTLEEAPFQMGKVIVHGKSKTRKINEQAYNVSALNAEKFHNSTISAAGVLNRMSSVRVMREGGLGSDYTFSLNGFSGNQVSFFIDGIPMDNYGSAFELSNIPASAIKRVEVYNGVVPVWLGGDALGGAVNIVTNKQANFLDASYTFGSFNTHRAAVNAAYTNEKTGFTVRGNLNYSYSDNDYDVTVDVDQDAMGNQTKTQRVPRFHDRYRSARAQVETGVVNRSWTDQFLIGVALAGDDDQIQNGSTMNSVYGGITQHSRSAIATLKYRKQDFVIDKLDLRFSAAYNYNESQRIDTLLGLRYNWAGEKFVLPGDQTGELGSDPFDQSHYDNGVNSQLNIGYALNPHHSFAFNYAFEYFHRKAFDRRNPDKIVNRFPKSLYKHTLGLAYKYDFSEKWHTTIFGKAYMMTAKSSKEYDFDMGSRKALEASNTNFGYGLASTYFILPNLQVKASYEHTYRLPTPTELFGNGLFVEANPELQPEESNNLNLGANYHFNLNLNHRFELGGSFIYRNASDLIFQVVNISSPKTSYNNLAKVRTEGVEGHISYDYKNQLHLGANITYQNITDQAAYVYNDYAGYQKNFNQGERLPNRPYLFGNANASYRFNDVFFDHSTLRLNYYFHFVKDYYLSWGNLGNSAGKNVIPQQTSHDIELVYSLENGKYNISFEVRNVTDELLYDKFYLQKPGRAFYIKLRYSF